ncbi:tRNA (adenosine(37)-N6)-threonylcarbamoyltransferase complex ATPase subunit type 1 TsaE [Sinimarinibacterium sp. CAU 1509]|uniref:tRNA (adenosine(37)-N6)-threonylcarbamoyltransferase complex ATPase subunit type 1 TsaE n=1 Tax=Sinimarinibacterium sp. CAU 1509 TaxID=2562283 RepID=UPI0010ACCF74|nr:tRNA (adenosine(37)-N6)-threonylcarbamoyltransferase complex ATPase subunit type 1 TsaE [Sinimarinibacterium sp. CAU 1509]TJY60930.1 tRNA (adenosine(37)-N6)-threonylcarbamoyltransferase complex ATPase subunit type 1 TsaE [Sinimarinibacterium sp. CAU 1509]
MTAAAVLPMALADAAETERLGAVVAAALRAAPVGVIELRGPLGAGKTTFARGLLHALGVEGIVRSPTYTLMEPYVLAAGTVLHMDLYRLVDPEEWWQLGTDSYPPEQTLWLVEWPEQAGGLLPAARLSIELAHRGGARGAELRGEPALLKAIAEIAELPLQFV